jgi:hypothetical protein
MTMNNRTLRHTIVAGALIALVGITASSAAAFAKRHPVATPAVAARHVSGDLGEVVVTASKSAATQMPRG